jgi:hypothetical protein
MEETGQTGEQAMTFVVVRQIATAVRWYPKGTVARCTWPIHEPVGTVRAVSFKHAQSKALRAYPDVEPELLQVIIA